MYTLDKDRGNMGRRSHGEWPMGEKGSWRVAHGEKGHGECPVGRRGHGEWPMGRRVVVSGTALLSLWSHL